MAKKKKSKPKAFVVVSAAKAYLNDKGYRASGDLIHELDQVVQDALEEGMRRAKDNNRNTVRPADL
jgi:hypothetical protein